MKRGLWVLLAAMIAAPVHARTPAPKVTGNAPSNAIEMPLSTTLREYEDWRIEQSSAFVAALTNNEAGSLFGMICSESCRYYFSNGKTCKVGSAYPALLSGANGAIAITLRCVHVREDGEEFPILLVDEDVSAAVGKASEIGIVVPLANGQFNVSRFSMAGAAEAFDEMLKISEKNIGAADFTL